MSENESQAIERIGRAADYTNLHPRRKERFMEVSGTDARGRVKATVILRHYLRYADGTERDIQVLTFAKPILNLFEGYGFLCIDMDFLQPYDEDLKVAFYMMDNFFNARNAACYLPEELERGTFEGINGEEPIYYPMMEAIISPIGRETEFQIHAFNILHFCLGPSCINGRPTVLKLLSSNDYLIISDHLNPVDYEKIGKEVEDDLANNLGRSKT